MVTLLQVSSLEKIFLDDNIQTEEEIKNLSALKGERVSYQILYVGEERILHVEVQADPRLEVSLREVGNVPAAMPAWERDTDEWYLRKTPGLYPDVLYPVRDSIAVKEKNCHSLFVTCQVPRDLEAGEYPVTIVFSAEERWEKKMLLHVAEAVLPEQTLTYTQWFHGDCIASYYKQEVFSESHWDMLEKFLKMAVHTGVNMILTPLFTLPLDTEVGKERVTMQLVGVRRQDGTYSFDFSKLKRWLDLCKKCGMKKYEMSHLFTQWGTGCTPKIMAQTEQGEEAIFGWHVKAVEGAYEMFLDAFLPQLIAFLQEEGVYENTHFHVSDEPELERDLAIYKAEYAMVAKHVPREKIMDAMSDTEFVELGLSCRPVVVISRMEEFIEKGIRDVWAYTCCVPSGGGFSNRLIAMPSGRNRVIGMLLYLYNIHGFLHWGYNFYNSRLSRRQINPFLVTDADEGFPAGDAFSVYPGEEGPLESLRSVVFYEGLQDYRACQLLESLVGREKVETLLREQGMKAFDQFPRSDAAILAVREKIQQEIIKNL